MPSCRAIECQLSVLQERFDDHGVLRVLLFILRSWIIGSDAGPSSGKGMRWHPRQADGNSDGLEGPERGLNAEWIGMFQLSMPLLVVHGFLFL